MASILAFAGSNSSTSINFQLVNYTVSQVPGHEIRTINMADRPFPMYSADYEREKGFPDSIMELKNEIQRTDALILSVNEHNGNPSAYFKNIMDWLSRVERKFLDGKKILLMSTSTGKRGGIGSLEVTQNLLSRFGAGTIFTFSLPSFNENFNVEKGITDGPLSQDHQKVLKEFLNAL